MSLHLQTFLAIVFKGQWSTVKKKRGRREAKDEIDQKEQRTKELFL